MPDRQTFEKNLWRSTGQHPCALPVPPPTRTHADGLEQEMNVFWRCDLCKYCAAEREKEREIGIRSRLPIVGAPPLAVDQCVLRSVHTDQRPNEIRSGIASQQQGKSPAPRRTRAPCKHFFRATTSNHNNRPEPWQRQAQRALLQAQRDGATGARTSTQLSDAGATLCWACERRDEISAGDTSWPDLEMCRCRRRTADRSIDAATRSPSLVVARCYLCGALILRQLNKEARQQETVDCVFDNGVPRGHAEKAASIHTVLKLIHSDGTINHSLAVDNKITSTSVPSPDPPPHRAERTSYARAHHGSDGHRPDSIPPRPVTPESKHAAPRVAQGSRALRRRNENSTRAGAAALSPIPCPAPPPPRRGPEARSRRGGIDAWTRRKRVVGYACEVTHTPNGARAREGIRAPVRRCPPSLQLAPLHMTVAASENVARDGGWNGTGRRAAITSGVGTWGGSGQTPAVGPGCPQREEEGGREGSQRPRARASWGDGDGKGERLLSLSPPPPLGSGQVLLPRHPIGRRPAAPYRGVKKGREIKARTKQVNPTATHSRGDFVGKRGDSTGHAHFIAEEVDHGAREMFPWPHAAANNYRAARGPERHAVVCAAWEDKTSTEVAMCRTVPAVPSQVATAPPYLCANPSTSGSKSSCTPAAINGGTCAHRSRPTSGSKTLLLPGRGGEGIGSKNERRPIRPESKCPSHRAGGNHSPVDHCNSAFIDEQGGRYAMPGRRAP
nr:unnamed protein product [Digitaria exilis]